MSHSPVVVAVSGVKNSGKTALIEAMLPHLTAAGLRAAVIKHDGHSFLPDDPATDTGRHLAAGACGTALFDGEKCRVVKRGNQPIPRETMDQVHLPDPVREEISALQKENSELVNRLLDLEAQVRYLRRAEEKEKQTK